MDRVLIITLCLALACASEKEALEYACLPGYEKVGDDLCHPVAEEEPTGTSRPDTATDDDTAAPDSPLAWTWSATGTTLAQELRYVDILSLDPLEVMVGSVRSGAFQSEAAGPSFTAMPWLGTHFYTPFVQLPGAPDTRLTSVGTELQFTQDGGATWEKRWPTWPDLDPTSWSSPDMVSGISADDTRVVLSDNAGRVWVSLDQAASFTHVGTVPVSVGPSGKHGDPGDLAPWTVKGTNTLLLEGDQMMLAWDGGSVFRSMDGGSGWTEVLEGRANRHAMLRTEERIYVGMEEGLYISTDEGLRWSRADDGPEHCVSLAHTGQTLALACDGALWLHTDDTFTRIETPHPVLSVSAASADPATIVAGLQVGLMWSSDGGETFAHITDGLYVDDLSIAAAHPEHPDTLLAGTYCTTGMYRSTDRGTSWDYSPSGAHYTMLIRYAPSDPERVYITNSSVNFLAGGADLQRSDDGGVVFASVAIPDSEQSHPHALAIHPWDADHLIIGTSSDSATIPYVPKLYRSLDGGESWDAFGTGLPDFTGAYMAAAYDPTDPNRVIVATGPGGNDHFSFALADEAALGGGVGLWITRDSTGSFEPITDGVVGDNAWDIAFMEDGTVFATTDHGVYRSLDSGETWEEVLSLAMGERVNLSLTPAQPDWVVVSEFEGLWLSTDRGTTWTSLYEDYTSASAPSEAWYGIYEVTFSADATSLYVSSTHAQVWRADLVQ